MSLVPTPSAPGDEDRREVALGRLEQPGEPADRGEHLGTEGSPRDLLHATDEGLVVIQVHARPGVERRTGPFGSVAVARHVSCLVGAGSAVNRPPPAPRPSTGPGPPEASRRRATVPCVQIAVVIPALQEADRIQDAIESAQAPNAVDPVDAVEVVVADGGSRDGTRERARAAGARVVESAPGRARQLAAGARETEAEVLLFLHADTRLPEGWDAAVRGALADPRVAGGAFGFRFEDSERDDSGRDGPGRDDPEPEGRGRNGSSLRLRWIERGVRLRLALARLPYGDQAIFLRRSVLEAMGGVPQVPIMEDLDLVRGIRAAGRLALLPLPVRTSARRYLAAGVVRTWLRNAGALVAWRLGLDRQRVAAWYQR